MARTAKLFLNGRSQAVRLPAEFRFQGLKEVYVRKDPDTGNVILSRRPEDTWENYFKFRDENPAPAEFMAYRKNSAPKKRDLF